MKNKEGEAREKRLWEPMKLSRVGHVSQVVESGEPGKLTPATFDPGDTFKPPGQG